MTSSITPRLSFLLLLIACLTAILSACGLLGKRHPEMHGRVLHEIHDKPLSHTIMVALWKGSEEQDDSEKQVCYHVETTTSDDTGYFSFPEWREPNAFSDLENKSVYIYGYRKYYRTSELSGEVIVDKNFKYYLAKPRPIENEDRAREARLRYLQQLVGKTTCDLEGESRKNLVPLFTAVITEAESLAVTNKDKQIVEKLKSWLSFVTIEEK